MDRGTCRQTLSQNILPLRNTWKTNRRNVPSPTKGQEKNLERQKPPEEEKKGKENLPTAGIIGVVTGGSTGGDSTRARKALIRAASSSLEVDNYKEVVITGVLEKEITFSLKDLEKGIPQHNNVLVISATVSNFLGTEMLRRVNTLLVGFNGSVVEPMGEIALPISIGTTPYRATRKLKFLIVDAPSSYNIIMGRPSLNSFRAVVSTVHMKLKFPHLQRNRRRKRRPPSCKRMLC
ncbi:UNVERIFIED_CONTAM: hypothetical protein Sradi_2057600 [Sesamum radiatum]|uniref:Uncharacterized protein n=1 Tax=Sesamum radiatum TaxID=300843 RepID=A0AAW2TI10_SESRA